MTKSTIITDAITYIEELKMTVEELSNHLLELEETRVDEEKIKLKEIDDEKEMKKHGIKVVFILYLKLISITIALTYHF